MSFEAGFPQGFIGLSLQQFSVFDGKSLYSGGLLGPDERAIFETDDRFSGW